MENLDITAMTISLAFLTAQRYLLGMVAVSSTSSVQHQSYGQEHFRIVPKYCIWRTLHL